MNASSRRWWAVAALLGCGCPGSIDGNEPDATPGPVVLPRDPPVCPDDAERGGFCDVTDKAGIDRADFHGPLDGAAGGVAVFDFDLDGDLDLFVTGLNIDSAMYANDGTGRFTDVTEAAGLAGVTRATGVGAADLDNDGDQDLIVTGMDSRLRLFDNDGTGAFRESGEGAGLGTDPFNGSSIAIGDYNNDGWLDVYVTIWISSPGMRATSENMLFRNEGGLRFTELAEAAGVDGGRSWFSFAASFFHLDDDGLIDLYVGNDFGMWESPNADLRNQGDGTFAPPSISSDGDIAAYAMSVSPGDYDNDGDLDVYVTNIGDNILLENFDGALNNVAPSVGLTDYGYRADDEEYGAYLELDPQTDDIEERQFMEWARDFLHPEVERQHVTTGWAALWLDYDHDTWLDLYICNGQVQTLLIPEGHRQPNQLYRSESGTTFTNVTPQAGVADRGTARGCATGDIDGDGDLDVIIVNSGRDDIAQGRFAIQRNDVIGGHWSRVHLVGTDSNRDGVGAMVRLTIGDDTYLRHVSGGDGILSSSQRDPHFGVGAATRIDQIEVTWPSGTVDTIADLPIDTTVTIVEGAGRLIGPAHPLAQ